MQINERGQRLIRAVVKPRLTVDEAEQAVDHMLRVEVNENQFAALVSLAVAIGWRRLERSAVIGYLNDGEPLRAAKHIRRLVPVDRTKRLMELRARQKALFLRPCLVQKESE